MKKIIKEELAFTGMMVAGMVVIMLSYNAILTVGFTVDAVRTIAIGLIPTYIVAFMIEQFVVSHTVHKLHKIIVSPEDPQFKHILVMALLFVTCMAGLMSLFGTLISSGTEGNFLYHYAINFARNWPVALVAQLLVVGPLVRLLHVKLFSRTTLVE